MKTKSEYKAAMREELEAARAITNRAEEDGRDLTGPERYKADAHLKAYKQLKSEFDQYETAGKLAGVGILPGDGVDSSFVKAGGERAAFRGREWGEKAATAIQALRQAGGSKALISGTVSVPDVLGGPITIDDKPTTVLDLIGRGNASEDREGNGFRYVRQTARTNNAAAVADGGTKPTSVYTFAEVDDTYRVYAHLSEVLPQRYLDDYALLVDILQAQMRDDLIAAIEEDVLDGAGGGANLVGILNTSGILTQAFATDVLTTLKTTKYKLTDSQVQPNGWLFNSGDLQDLELMREGAGTGPFLFSDGISSIEKWLGAPALTSPGIAAGTVLAGNFREGAELIPLGDDALAVDTSGELFEKNQMRFRMEGRYGFRVHRPFYFVKATITGGA